MTNMNPGQWFLRARIHFFAKHSIVRDSHLRDSPRKNPRNSSREEGFVGWSREGLWEAVAYLGQEGQLCRRIIFELTFFDAPAPVTSVQARGVHTSFAAEAQHILHGDDTQAGR